MTDQFINDTEELGSRVAFALMLENTGLRFRLDLPFTWAVRDVLARYGAITDRTL